jgi:hypothetical protein
MTQHHDKNLSISVSDTAEEIRLRWQGKSNDREPGRFVVPILQDALSRAKEANKAIAIDFAEMEYMNSSTFTPLVKMLDEANRGGLRVRVEYSQTRKWQTLSFSALKAFETPDGRIAFCAK